MTAKRRKCEGGCGRWLRAPASVALGFGPKCAKELAQSSPGARSAPQDPGVPPRRSRRLTGSAPCPGQTELPLSPMQPTLWSL